MGLTTNFGSLQGSHWSRTRREFVTHDARAAPLATRVCASDVPRFARCDPSSRFVLYSDRQRRAWPAGLHEGAAVRLARGESDLISVVPLSEAKGISVAAIGAPCLPRIRAAPLGYSK
jgi:hypothetical protein